jgi:hypothetical protein
MQYGELAMGYKRHQEKLFIKNSTNTITEFSSDEQLKAIRDAQDEKVANGVGLTASIDETTGNVNYTYSPGAESLSSFSAMTQSVDYLAQQLKACYDIIDEMKTNVYMIETNFTVEPNTAFTQYVVSYQTTYNENPTTPKSCTITKYVNDGSGTVILSNTSTASATTTSNITGAKEQYVIEVVPDLDRALNTRVEETRYLCYVGASTATTMTSSIVENFKKHVSNGIRFTAQQNTMAGDYLWIVIPNYLNIQFVTSNGITFTLSSEVQTITNSFGTFKCYRSNKALDTAVWPIVVHHIIKTI